MPLFGFANAGVSLDGGVAQARPLPLAIALGLFLGKQMGMFGSVCVQSNCNSHASVESKLAPSLWRRAPLRIGFTMSLFIGGLAFPAQPQADAVKIGVLMGSLLSALAGVTVLRFAGGRK